MTRASYLQELGQRIANLPAADRQDILADYDEHFRVGAAKGKTEEQISQSLGTPKSVAQSILVNTYVAEAETSKTIVDRSGAIFQILLAVLILAPFNFLVLVCPFMVMIALLITGWMLPLVAFVSAIAMVIAVIPAIGLLGGWSGLSILSAGIGSLGLTVVTAILMILATRGVLSLIVSYCKWNLNFIQARRAA